MVLYNKKCIKKVPEFKKVTNIYKKVSKILNIKKYQLAKERH